METKANLLDCLSHLAALWLAMLVGVWRGVAGKLPSLLSIRCWRRRQKPIGKFDTLGNLCDNVVLRQPYEKQTANIYWLVGLDTDKNLLLKVAGSQGKVVQTVKVKGFRRSWEESSGAFLKNIAKLQERMIEDKAFWGLASTLFFPNRQVFPPSHLSPFCLQALEATLAFLIRQFGWETSLSVWEIKIKMSVIRTSTYGLKW